MQDQYTLNLITNPVALMVNEHSDGLRVSYAGDCACTLKGRQHGHACKPINDPSSTLGPCVATWWSNVGPKCRAVAFLNVGATDATAAVGFAAIGLAPSASYTVTQVFEKVTRTASGSADLTATVPGNGGVMFVVSPAGVPPNECVAL